ncbi:sensor histidine kinase [Bacillus sp. B-jedd]|uniref:sensor histidine kinase n=1 Tax=Bacillus sp. B-jedd TaxID=1476857 RepID=UPI0005156995|nr:ATP-binding protein [Bacillus sp. B-jedd]CEG26502.1 PAS/PAC sensor signal transduction histidine kinase [Bacillus sp. B-jedd]
MDKNQPLKRQLAFIFLFLSLVPICILGVFHGNGISEEISQSSRSQKYAAQRLSEVVETYVGFHINYIESISYNISRMKMLDQKSMTILLEGAKTKLPGFMELYVGDKDGKIVASYLEGGVIGELKVGADVSSRDHFKSVKQGEKTIITPILVGRHTKTPMILIASPLKKQGEFNGYVLGMLDLSALTNTITDYDYGKGAYPVVVDQEQKIIYHPGQQVITKNYDVQMFKNKYNLEGSQTGEGKYYSSVYQRPEFMSYEKINSLNWHVFVSRPVSIMNEGYKQAIYLLGAVLLFTLLLTQFLAMRLSKKMLGPVGVLMDYSAALEQKSFTLDQFEKIQLKNAAKEYNLLLHRFYEMGKNIFKNREDLLKLNRELEQRVEERTEGLRIKNSQLELINEMIEYQMPQGETEAFLQNSLEKLSGYLGISVYFEKDKTEGCDWEKTDSAADVSFAGKILGRLVFERCLDETARDFVSVYSRSLGIILYNHYLMNNLSRHNEVLKTVTENMNDGFALLDRDYGITYSNGLFANTLRLAGTSLTGLDVIDLSVRIPFSKISMKDDFLTIMEEDCLEVVFAISTEAGERHLSMAKFLLHEEDEKFGFGIVLRDMTKEKEIEELKNRLISFTSHEYKTPITTLKGSIETLLRKDVQWDVDFIEELLRGMEDDVKRLEQLTSDWLDIVKIDSNALVLIKEKTRIGTFIEGVLQGLKKPPFTEAEIIYKVRPEANPVVSFDLKRLEQVIRNIITNAIRYSNGKPRIEISIHEGKDAIYLDFCDNGIGIAKENLQKIFDKFFHVDASRTRKSGGTGLGLAICKGIVDAHGWELYVQSELSAGSKFTVKIPNDRQVEDHEA